MSPEEMTGGVPLPVLLAAAGPAQQRRWTVLIRWIMLIPHIVVLYFLNIAFAVVTFIGWWGALFTGRLPGFAVTYLSGVIRWTIRVQAYALLLTDQYPPFSLDDEPGYPVRVAIPSPDRLNRLAVLFRFILVIPAGLLLDLVRLGGTTIVGFIAWLIVLITGKLPTSLHLAYIAILRYMTRYYGYSCMLTAAYPGGFFGDGIAMPDGAAVPPAGDLGDAAPGDETSAAAASDASDGDETPFAAAASDGAETPFAAAASDGAETPLAAASDYGIPGYQAPVALAPQPADWPLLLTQGVKQLLGWFIGIGAVLWVAYIVVIVIISSQSTISVSNAIDRVTTANTTLAGKVNNYQTTVQSCTDASCVETANAQAATAFTNFANTVHDTPMPASAVTAANKVYSDATKVAQDLTQLSHLSPTISATQYGNTANSIGIGQAITQFQQDYAALGDALNSSR